MVFVVAVGRLLTEDRPPRADSIGTALAAGLRAMPATVTGAVRLSVTDGPMRLVLVLTAVGGLGLVGCELLGPVRFADLAGGRDGGAAVYGTVLAVSFAGAAVGAMLTPGLRRLLGGSTRMTCALLVPPLPAALSTGGAFLVVAVVVLLGAVGCLGLPRATVAVPTDAEVTPLSAV